MEVVVIMDHENIAPTEMVRDMEYLFIIPRDIIYQRLIGSEQELFKQFLVDFRRQQIMVNQQKVDDLWPFIRMVVTLYNESDIFLYLQQTIMVPAIAILQQLFPDYLPAECSSGVSINIDTKNKREVISKKLIMTNQQQLLDGTENPEKIPVTIKITRNASDLKNIYLYLCF